MTYTTVKLPGAVGSQLKEVARLNCRSMASQIAYMLKQYPVEESFEDYYEHNKPYIDEAYNDAVDGKNCSKFSSWEEAQNFLKNKEKEWDAE